MKYLLPVGSLLLVLVALPSVALANYEDNEISGENTFATGSVDIELAVSGSADTRAVEIVNQSSIAETELSLSGAPGVGDLCSALTLSVTSGSVSQSGPASGGFGLVAPLGSTLSVEVGAVSATPETLLTGECTLALSADAYLSGMGVGQGLTDHEVGSLTFSAADVYVPPAPPSPAGCANADTCVVLNEFLPDPATGPNDEFIELYNNSTTQSFDLTGWSVSEFAAANEKFYILGTNPSITVAPASFIIPPQGFLVVYLNGAKLNNGGDTVSLYNAGNTQIDTFTYTSSVSGKSIARIPDGTGPWVDPVPNPGEPNVCAADEECLPAESVAPSFEPSVEATPPPVEDTQEETKSEEDNSGIKPETPPEEEPTPSPEIEPAPPLPEEVDSGESPSGDSEGVTEEEEGDTSSVESDSNPPAAAKTNDPNPSSESGGESNQTSL